MSRGIVCMVAMLAAGVAAFGGETTYSTTQDGVSITWTSVADPNFTTATHTWEVAGSSTVVATLRLADPYAPTWEGTLNSQTASGALLLVEGTGRLVGIFLFDADGGTLAYFEATRSLVGAMIPQFDPSAIAVDDDGNCVCHPGRTGNRKCSIEDCRSGVECNTTSVCLFRHNWVLPIGT
jgi:hypothetical protein